MSDVKSKADKKRKKQGQDQADCWVAATVYQSNWAMGGFWGKRDPRNFRAKIKRQGHMNENRALLCAIIKALRVAEEQGISKLAIHTNSSYVVDSGREYMRNWDSVKDQNIMHRGEWQEIYNAQRSRRRKLNLQMKYISIYLVI